jgi:hypothetical protein
MADGGWRMAEVERNLLMGSSGLVLLSPFAIRHSPCLSTEGRHTMKRSIGLLLLAAWLILTGVIPLINLSFAYLGTVMAVLAIAAGVLIAIGR